jgi:Mn-dependent DtxR family transcriptional regulator
MLRKQRTIVSKLPIEAQQLWALLSRQQDGSLDTEEMALLLGLEPQALHQALAALQTRGLVHFRERTLPFVTS